MVDEGGLPDFNLKEGPATNPPVEFLALPTSLNDYGCAVVGRAKF